jgi:hypothetical protein
MSIRPTTGRHQDLYTALCDALAKFPDVPADEMLAVVAKLTGRVLAVQDQRKYTPARAIEIVSWNLELGNREMIESLLGAPAGGSA